MEAGILVLIAIVVIVIVVRTKKRKNAINDLKNIVGYELAEKIAKELTNNGYTVRVSDPSFSDGKAIGGFYVYDKDDSCGHIYYCKYPSAFWNTVAGLQLDNARLVVQGCHYIIQDNNTGLLIYSDTVSEKVPQFMEIAAKVIKDSGYLFKHPDYLHTDENAKKYVNVMFQ